jgi:hypothetical protein
MKHKILRVIALIAIASECSINVIYAGVWGGSHNTNSDAHAVPPGGNAGTDAGTAIKKAIEERNRLLNDPNLLNKNWVKGDILFSDSKLGTNNQPLLIEDKNSNNVQKD